jgi:hypothetical protein
MCWGIMLSYQLQGKEGGFNWCHFARLQMAETLIDPENSCWALVLNWMLWMPLFGGL